MSRARRSDSEFPPLQLRSGPDWATVEAVPASAWVRLERLVSLEIPAPPAGALGDRISIETLGPKRAGVAIEVQRVVVPAKFMPGRPPPGSEDHARWRPNSGTDFGEMEVREQRPGRWEVSQLASAYREARRILRHVGLPHDAETWCWRDAARDWWAFRAPDDADVVLADVDGPRRAWPLYRRGRTLEGQPRMGELLASFGGPVGPLAWAFFVVDAARDLRGLARGPGADRHAFALGLEIGQRLAEFVVLGHVAASEAERAAAGGKTGLRALLRQIAKEEFHEHGHLEPYKLADILIAEGRSTDRGRQLAEQGVPTRDRLGRLITEEAEAEGIYRRR